ncbi:Neurolysin/Thimet oligopeptidase N-terminal [Penicillium psychrosexuale]|uniref:Neurolysin/Thimet oligopeptidase N-terminal n=1 Tax=Penicillium psychrosexuale TaxID=1002107 RepID=UPI0025452C5A|nr:Neurolysin/Thimet oligopeptidase N-terminal [Penicillium psychrosexuale]KAJ5789783.1 Neurolysin/Thimet oligopeptidase N-terminal [Penicillium psychrosexuale]
MTSTIPELPIFNLGPSTLLDIATDLVNRVQQAANDLVNRVLPQNATFENTLRPLADIDNEVKGKVQYLALFQAVSPSSEMRTASSTAVNMVDKAYWGVFQIPSLFALVNVVYKKHEEDSHAEENAKSEDRKLLKRFHSMFMENRLELQGDKRDRFLWISNRLIELRVAFMENLSCDPGCSYSSARKHKQPVATALVCNVSQSSSDKPALLQRRELITIFHELGHAHSTRILAADMWLSNFHSNPMSSDAGLRYRKMILAPGGSQNEMMALKAFLGGRPRLTHIFEILMLVNKANQLCN